MVVKQDGQVRAALLPVLPEPLPVNKYLHSIDLLAKVVETIVFFTYKSGSGRKID